MHTAWSDDPATFRRQFLRRAGNHICQHRPLGIPPAQTAAKVLELGPLRSDR